MRLIVVLLLAAASLSACGGGAGGADVRGEWELAEGTADGAPLPRPAGTRATLELDGGELRGIAFCNSYFASYRDEAGSFSVDGIGRTEMGCEPAVMAAETAFLDALGRATTVNRRGEDLVLAGDGVELRFSQVPSVPDAPLAGTRWVLESVVDGETASSTVGQPAVLELSADGTLSASTGCRDLTGTWRTEAGSLLPDGLHVVGDECPAEAGRQDAHVTAVLGAGPLAEIQEDRLTLRGKDGRGLVYRADVADQALLGSWELVEGTAHGDALPLPDGARATLTFSPGSRAGGTAFCNGYGGRYVRDGEELRLEDVAVSLVMCEGPVGVAEGVYLDLLLHRAHRFSVDAEQLVLTSSAGELSFRRLQPPAVEAVTGRRWLLESVATGAGPAPATGDAALELRPDGTAVVTTGCRHFEATWRTGADSVHLEDGEYEILDCPPEVADQDRALVAVLGGGFQLRVDGDVLTLAVADTRGAPGATLHYRAQR
jgi:heat shock protein HslJ